MRERIWFVYVAQVVAMALCLWTPSMNGTGAAAEDVGPVSITRIIVFALVMLTLLSVKLLLEFMKLPRICCIASAAGVCAAVLLFSPASALPILLVIFTEFFDEYLPVLWTLCASAILSVIFFAILRPGLLPLIFTAFLVGMMIYVLSVIRRKNEILENSMRKSQEIDELRKSLLDGRRTAQNMEYTTKLLERNRLASRIHDEVGHGMSGSILLLEGANTVILKDPAKAKETVSKAIGNLRSSVDKIRSVLREERADASASNLSQIEKELLSFGTDHPEIETSLDTAGDMNGIEAQIWLCIKDNLREALTNVLKHSGGSVFRVTIENKNKLLSVGFSDNGRGAAGRLTAASGRGIGLQGMEERTALCYGRIFFEGDESGFRIRMNFPAR
ncbi:MAG: histidine kinase [Clostridiales Family XIII bacterium]|jgi:signal transduction histidine kinase|nr:histidine kinase [Clostridiales Family XIII bacterium]